MLGAPGLFRFLARYEQRPGEDPPVIEEPKPPVGTKTANPIEKMNAYELIPGDVVRALRHSVNASLEYTVNREHNL